MDTKDYEKNFFFRLNKVVYVLLLICAIGISLMAGWFARPVPEVDDAQSYLACNNGQNYNLDANRIYVYSVNTTSLSSYQDEEARKLCAYNVLNDYSTAYNNLKMPQLNYTLHIVEGTRGSWGDALLWWVIGISGSYIVLNLVRETLNYVFLGKKFDFMWLWIPLAMLASNDES